ncbi:acetyl-CoA synthase subunit gamma [bacterium]|nr:acetyl-CoA synthase subunit gamma [bacterium]
MSEKKKYLFGNIETAAGPVMLTTSGLCAADHWGGFLARFDIGRMDYTVAPGIYGLNQPDANSPVFVSANYKMSFDALRSRLKKISAWILVLDTHGINVWCAAGKGTFGTGEMIARVKSVRLDEIVTHRKLIVPQLGAPGVAAHQVRQAGGFQVIYGPVRAKNIPAFIENEFKTTEKMRRIYFTVFDRAVLIPVEVIGHMKYVFWALLYFMLLSSVHRYAFSLNAALAGGIIAAVFLFAGLAAGTILTPLLLPFIPGRAFAGKGALMGVLVYGVLKMTVPAMAAWVIWDDLAWSLMVVSLASFSAMNFTGTSTYTSLSGVLKEMKIAVPIQIAVFVIGVVIWTVGQFT